MEIYTLQSGSRLDNSKGYLITKKPYSVQIVKRLKYNFVIVKIGKQQFKTDRNNLK